MRISTGFGIVAACGVTFVAVLVANPSAALAADEDIAGYCLYFHENSVYYRTPVFRAAAFNKHRFTEDWKSYLYDSGVKYYVGVTCRAWPGGADAVASASAAAAKAPEYTQRIVELDWVPNNTVRANGGGAIPRESRSGRDSSVGAKAPAAKATPAPRAPAAPKYVEVAGTDGPIRLSPEVAARNQAAADEYRRKMAEHDRAKADHARKLALHQQSIAAAAAEKRAYEQQLAMNDAAVAAHGAAMAQHRAATQAPAAGAKGWMYCDARGAPGDKRRFYSRVVEVDYAPGQVTIIDVSGRNRPAFKAYVAGTHAVAFTTDSLLHCPYSTTSLADAEALMARDKRGDATNDYQIVQTGWTPAS